ncbi:MAG: YbgA family protein [Calditrichaceae bacterium]
MNNNIIDGNNFKKIRVGISSCLLGLNVRFDGGHKKDPYITSTLGEYFEWVPVCPEVETGMGIPRESIRLKGESDQPRLIAQKSGKDHTNQMNEYARNKITELSEPGISGYIVKKGSPTCGMWRVRVYNDKNMPSNSGTGLYAKILMESYPLLPVEEEGRLNDIRLRENFVERVFTFNRLLDFLGHDPGPSEFIRFHSRHKLMLLAHSPAGLSKLGKIVSQAGNEGASVRIKQYLHLFMSVMNTIASVKNHTNVLHHMAGYFKKLLSSQDKRELASLIDEYRNKYVPLVVPLTLINHHLRNYPVPWIQDQIYLNPYPRELLLRNSI